MNEDAPLLKPTLRATAFMLVPVAAFLAILSAVALSAGPQPAQKDAQDTAEHASPAADREGTPHTPSTRARSDSKPNKI